MIEERLADCRPSRREDDITSASSHPELLCGYLAMRPRCPIRLTPAEQTTSAIWSRCTLGTLALLTAAVVLLPIFWGPPNAAIEARAAEDHAASACAHWDELASEAIVRLVQQGKHDAELRQVSDAVFRMRRARRNCQMNWVGLACHDYHAIVQGVPGITDPWPLSSSVCGLAADDRIHGASR
jgi:hypothetical protein